MAQKFVFFITREGAVHDGPLFLILSLNSMTLEATLREKFPHLEHSISDIMQCIKDFEREKALDKYGFMHTEPVTGWHGEDYETEPKQPKHK